jgi:prepilin peptidase CpaA
MTTDSLFMAGALAVAVIGSATDIATRRIPNRLTYFAMLAALAGRFAVHGWRGLGSGIAGGLIAGGAFLVFFLIRAMGAGDVKLVTAVGCFVGPTTAVEVVLASTIAGGVFALIFALWQGRLRIVLANVVKILRFHATEGAEVHPSLNLSNPQSTRLPYGVAIAAGVLYSAMAFYCRGGI